MLQEAITNMITTNENTKSLSKEIEYVCDANLRPKKVQHKAQQLSSTAEWVGQTKDTVNWETTQQTLSKLNTERKYSGE